MTTFQKLVLAILAGLATFVVVFFSVVLLLFLYEQRQPQEVKVVATSTRVALPTKVSLPTRALSTATRVPTEVFDEECSPEIMKDYADTVIIYSDYMINEQLIYFRKVEVLPVRYVSAAFNVGDIAVEFQNNEVPDCPETIALYNATIDWFKTMNRIARAQGMGEKNQYSTMTLEDLEPKMQKVAEGIARITLLQ